LIRIDEGTRTAVVEPGVINATLAKAALERGLYYAPDPASRDISTIGGNIATNAGGSCCLKYGTTGDHVAALRVALADGTLIETGRVTTKDVAGLDLTRLFVGSEGVLGVIVEATVRLLRAPRPASTLVAFFDRLADAARRSSRSTRGSIFRSSSHDRTTVRAVEELASMDLDTEAAAFVLAQSDAADAIQEIETATTICNEHRAKTVFSTSDADEAECSSPRAGWRSPPSKRRARRSSTTSPSEAEDDRDARPDRICRDATRGRHRNLRPRRRRQPPPDIVFDRSDERSVTAAYAAFDAILTEAIASAGRSPASTASARSSAISSAR